MNVFWACVRREWMVNIRRPSELVNAWFFFIVVVSLFPLAIAPKPETLQTMASGILWVAALLAVLLSIESLFRDDESAGILEQLLVVPGEMIWVVLAKLLVHWLMIGLPLVLVSPLLGYMLQLPPELLPVVMYSLALGTPSLILIGAIGAGLTVGLQRGGVLLSLLILPLYVPVLVFGAGAIQRAMAGHDISSALAVLGAILALTVSLGPWAIIQGLKISTGD